MHPEVGGRRPRRRAMFATAVVVGHQRRQAVGTIVGVPRRLLAVTALGVLALLTVEIKPVAAHARLPIYHGRDKGMVTDVHDALIVQDNECDGNGVYVEGYDFDNTRWRIWDPNGCSVGDGVAIGGSGFWMFRICENRVGCTEWTPT